MFSLRSWPASLEGSRRKSEILGHLESFLTVVSLMVPPQTKSTNITYLFTNESQPATRFITMPISKCGLFSPFIQAQFELLSGGSMNALMTENSQVFAEGSRESYGDADARIVLCCR